MRRAHIQAHLAGQTPRFTCELRLRHKLGHWVWVLDSGCIIARNAQGQPLTMIGARQDISARKQAQVYFLRQESERFMALARVSNTGVWEWDAPAAHLWCSPEYFPCWGAAAPTTPPASTSTAYRWSRSGLNCCTRMTASNPPALYRVPDQWHPGHVPKRVSYAARRGPLGLDLVAAMPCATRRASSQAG